MPIQAPCPCTDQPARRILTRPIFTRPSFVGLTPAVALRHVIQLWKTQRAMHRSCARLAALEPHLLRDIGLTAQAAAREVGRPVWDAPVHGIRR